MSRPFTKESFDQKWIESETGCWEWQATKNQDGYGRVKRLGKLESAHRVSYELYKGPLKGLHVCHSCDNPGCVNPDHLWLGTHKENQEDKALKGRGYANRMPGSQHPSSKLTEKDIPLIRADDRSQSTIAKEYGVSQTIVGLIKARKRWTHL